MQRVEKPATARWSAVEPCGRVVELGVRERPVFLADARLRRLQHPLVRHLLLLALRVDLRLLPLLLLSLARVALREHPRLLGL
jgi:hypothetical protein